MYYGSYYHKLEAKGRVSVPAKFRDKLGLGAIITRGLDGSLYIYDLEHWQKKLAEAQTLGQTKKSHREYIRYLTNQAQEVEVDALGRINIAEELKRFVGIEKNVVFVGSLDHIEIWDQEKYRAYMEKVEQSIEDTVEVIDIER
jgi:MraZ protein